MSRTRTASAAAVVALTVAALLAACGRSTSTGTTKTNSGNIDPLKGLVTTTPAGKKPVQSVTWAVYRDVNSLDPIYAFDYPENTAVSLLCESLLRQSPTGAVGPGLATIATPSPTKFVFTLRAGVKFWDGNPVTPTDVVYSLQRAQSSKLGGFYTQVFTRVQSIKATGSRQVTVTLKQPDYWFEGEMASMPGVVIEKKFAEAKGKKYGTPGGSIMCTGAYKFKSFSPGVGVTAVANPGYWNKSVHPMVQSILLKGVPDTAAFTSGMQTGAISGAYTYALSTLDQLRGSKKVKVIQGPGWLTDAFIVSSRKGVLGDVRVRQALSLALDRHGIINSVYKGAALMPKWISNPGTFGYGRSVFDAAYNKAPYLAHDIAKAKKLVQQAGAAGKSFTIGTSSQLSDISAAAGAYQAAAQAIGLKANLKSVSANNYINFFIDPKARAGIDAFLTVNYGDYADPAALLSTIVLPEGSQNYDGYDNKQIISLMEQARSTADPNKRAALIVKVEQITAKELPWIPDVQPTSLLLLNKNLTGATASFSYMFAPWADTLGGAG
jgi:peptide/nickel transport system substrate-binding protein